MQNRERNRLMQLSSKMLVAFESYTQKTDFPLFIVKIGGKMRFFRIYAGTNAKIKNRRKITSGEFRELSNELSLVVCTGLSAEKTVNVTDKKKKHTQKKTQFHSHFSILDIYIK